MEVNISAIWDRFLDLIDFANSIVISKRQWISEVYWLIFFSVELMVKANLKSIYSCFPSDKSRNSVPVFIITWSYSVHWFESRTIESFLSCHRTNNKSIRFIDFKPSDREMKEDFVRSRPCIRKWVFRYI